MKKRNDANDPLAPIKTWWRGLSQQNKLLVGGGAAIVLLLAIVAIGNGGGGNTAAYSPYGQGYQGPGYQGQVYQGQGYPGQPGVVYGPNGGAPAGDDPTGYWERQRALERQSRAFSGYIRDTDTVRNNQTGEVYTDVPNVYADPAIEGGGYSQVPTAELPTTTPAPAEPAPAPAE